MMMVVSEWSVRRISTGNSPYSYLLMRCCHKTAWLGSSIALSTCVICSRWVFKP